MRKIFLLLSLWVLPALAGAQIPKSNHVVLVVEENHSYSSVIGSSSMPYLNSLASQNTLFTQYYASTHPSIGNYLMMTTGQIITNNDSFTGTVTQDNIVRHMLTAGKTWKSYAESLPSAGYTGGNTGAYVRRHNPFTYFSDVLNSSVEKLNLVPFTQFANDLNNNALPDLSYIVPNVNDDAHNGTLAQADNWLKANIAPLLSNAQFQKDGILIIVFDESVDTDTAHGGGHIAALMVGPGVKKGFKSGTLYQHQNLLRTIMDALGMNSYPGAAAGAADMADAFTANPSPSPSPTPTPTPRPSPTPTPTPTPTPGPPAPCNAGTVSPSVTICSPANGGTMASPVAVVAVTRDTRVVQFVQAYVDGKAVVTQNGSSLNAPLSMSTGTHRLTVQAKDSAGVIFKQTVNITVGSSPTPTPTPSPTPAPAPSVCTASNVGVRVCSPTGGATVGSPVRFTAAAKSSLPITAMRIYIDNVSAYLTKASSLDASLAIAAGTHHVVVQAWNSGGTVYKTPLTITVATSVAGCVPGSNGVTVCSPSGGAVIASPVQFIAAARSSLGAITAMRIYVDNVSKYSVNAGSVDTSVALAAGAHNLVVQAWDSSGAVYKNARTIMIQ